MSRPQILGLDIDGVLADFVGGFNRLAHRLTGKPLPAEPECWDYFLLHGYTQDEVDGVWHHIHEHPEWWLTLRPLVGHLYFPLGAVVYYVTNRPLRKGVHEATEAWLRQHISPRGSLVMTRRKGEAASALHLARFIDDRPENLSEILDVRRGRTKLTLQRRPWNVEAQARWRTVGGVEEWLGGGSDGRD